MRAWLYLAVGILVGAVIAVGAIVIAGDGDDTPQGAADSGDPGAGDGAAQEPPEIAEVKEAVVAFRQALQGGGRNPCELMTPEARVALYGFFSGSPPGPTRKCANAALETLEPRYMGQREIPADAETMVVVRGRHAAALARGDVLPLFLTRTDGRWLIADDDELPARALVEALERGEGQ